MPRTLHNSDQGVTKLILGYYTPVCVAAFWRYCDFVDILVHTMCFSGNRCYDNKGLCVLGKPNPKFILVVWRKLSSASHRFRVICDYSLQWDFLQSAPKMAHFVRPIPPKRTDLNFAQGHTVMSFQSIWRTRHLCALLPFGDIAQSVHFWGHVTRFYSNCYYGNHGVSSESATPSLY